MSDSGNEPGRSMAPGLHSVVWKIVIGFAIWLVLAVWTFDDRSGYIGLALAVVSIFIFFSIALPIQLWRIWRRAGETAAPASNAFADWLKRDVETWQERLSGATALAQILIPISSVVLAMTLLAILHHFIVSNAA